MEPNFERCQVTVSKLQVTSAQRPVVAKNLEVSGHIAVVDRAFLFRPKVRSRLSVLTGYVGTDELCCS
jgi:hypothetical protein